MSLLELRGICKSYRGKEGPFAVLDGVNLNVQAGEIVGLVGASGSGKSSIARIATGLDVADDGTLLFEGERCDASLRPARRSQRFRRAQLDMQMVFQNPASTFSPRMKIGNGIAEGIAYRDVAKSERRARVLGALDAVGLPRSYAGKYAWELSGGECQRAALARAIVGEPCLLVADEPTSALDVTIQAQIVRLINELCRSRGMACLFVSHDLALVYGLCDRMYVLDAGRIVEEGTTDQVFNHAESAAAQRLIASIAEI